MYSNFQYFHCQAQTTGNPRSIKMISVKIWFHIYSSLVKSDATNSLVATTTIDWNDCNAIVCNKMLHPRLRQLVIRMLLKFKWEFNKQFMLQCYNYKLSIAWLRNWEANTWIYYLEWKARQSKSNLLLHKHKTENYISSFSLQLLAPAFSGNQ